MKKIIIAGTGLLIVIFLLLPKSSPGFGFFVRTVSLPAFPGCEGFGCETPGGRLGQVIEVTTLADSGPGSLRAAIGAMGPRIVVFRVGGTIKLNSTLDIWNPFLTIAGQSAPGGGIALRVEPLYRGPAIWIHTHDVVIRYLRIRPGFEAAGLGDVNNLSAIRMSSTTEAVYNIVLDHISASWAVDETISTWRAAHDITIQWSIISETLPVANTGSSFGMLLGFETGSGNITIHHNLFAHNNQRNPFVDVPGVVEIVNNVLYDTNRHIDLRNTNGTPLVNIIGNYQRSGVNTRSDRGHMVNSGVFVASMYVQGNISHWRTDLSGDELTGIVRGEDQGEIVQFPYPSPHAATNISASEAYNQVLAEAGAILPARDVVDGRIISDVINKSGAIISHPNEVGGWPDLAAGEPLPDGDHDGMPDDWEMQFGFDLADPIDGNGDSDGDGYTNIEEFLNNTIPAIILPMPETIIITVELPISIEQGQIISQTISNNQLIIEVIPLEAK